MITMNITELEAKYGTLPDNLDRKKVERLLKKRENKNELVVNLFADVSNWLTEHEILFVISMIEVPRLDGNKSYLKCLTIDDKVKLILVDNYQDFHKKVVKKNAAEKIHKPLEEAGFRVVWCKKFEWETPSKRQVMQSLILHLLGKTPHKVYARNTIACVVESNDLRKFFDESSFYGYRSASHAVALKDKKTGEILQAMSFGHPYYGRNKYGDNCVECIRSAGKPFTIVVGGMTKLMKFYIETFKEEFDSIVFYVDDAHHHSQSMDANSFEFSHFAGNAVHNVWQYTGAMFMRTPALHKEIMYMQKIGEILGVPDVGNSTYILSKAKVLQAVDDASTD